MCQGVTWESSGVGMNCTGTTRPSAFCWARSVLAPCARRLGRWNRVIAPEASQRARWTWEARS